MGTDQPTDGPTAKVFYRGAMLAPKNNHKRLLTNVSVRQLDQLVSYIYPFLKEKLNLFQLNTQAQSNFIFSNKNQMTKSQNPESKIQKNPESNIQKNIQNPISKIIHKFPKESKRIQNSIQSAIGGCHD